MTPRRTLLVVLAVALAISLPSIALAFYSDDYALLSAVEGRLPIAPPSYDLYRFVSGDVAARIATGTLPWWASPQLHLHLVRPLASVLLAADVKLFGHAPLGYHLHSIAWYLALVAAVTALHRRLLPGATGTIAALLFAVNEAHVSPWGWVSCRHMTIAAFFSVLAVLAIVPSGGHPRPRGRWLAAGFIALGLLGGETALGGVAYVVAYAVETSPAPDRWRKSMRLAGPTLGVLFVYLLAYGLVGGGAAHSDGYRTPMSSPLAFAIAAVWRLPIMLGNATLAVPSDLSNALPVTPLVVLGLLGCGIVAALARAVAPAMSADERSALRWLVPGAILAIVPALGGFLGARLLLLPNVGFCALFAVLLRRGFTRAGGAKGARLALARAATGLFAFLRIVAAPAMALALTAAGVRMARGLEAVSRDVASFAAPGDRVFVLVASDPMASIYPPMVLLAGDVAWGRSCWSIASGAKAAHGITRTGPRSLAIEPRGLTLLVGAFERLFRPSDEPLRTGDLVRQCGAVYRVAAEDDGRPTRVEVAFDAQLDDPRMHIAAWQDGHLRPLAIPAEGRTVEVPWSPGPTGLF
jgi:hypothetical protein